MGMIRKSDKEIQADKQQRIMDGIAFWAGYYRANIEKFCEEYLGIKLKLFQKIILRMMNYNTNFYYIASRGQGKTYLSALFAVCRAILYPGQKILVVSYTFKQSRELISKITDDFMHNSRMLNFEIENIKTGQNECVVSFKNGSFIKAITATESSRGGRSHCILIDESRLIPQKIVDTILRPMNSSPRHPGYLDKPEYKDYPQEMNKEIYMSSAYFSSSEMYDKVKSYVANMFSDRLKYMVVDLPYMLSIEEGLLLREQIEQEMSEQTFNDISFMMERMGLFYSSAEDALFTYKVMQERRILEEGLQSLSYYNLNNLKIPPKQKGEKRVLSVDIALMASRKHDNDASAIIIHSAMPTSSHSYIDNILYIETKEGLLTDELGLLVMRYFYQYNCDYLVIDAQGVGQGCYDYLMTDRYDPMYGQTYGALSCCNNAEMAERCKVKGAPKVIWSVKANAQNNSAMIMSLRSGLQNGYINLLKDEESIEPKLSSIIKHYNKMNMDEQTKVKLPYIQTSLLINEMINLEHDMNGNLIKVHEKSGMRKDRYSSLMYGYWVIQELSKNLKPKNQNTDNIVDKFKIRKPQLRRYGLLA